MSRFKRSLNLLLVAAALLVAAIASPSNAEIHNIERRNENNNNRPRDHIWGREPHPIWGREPHPIWGREPHPARNPARNHVNRPVHADRPHYNSRHSYRPGMHHFVSPHDQARQPFNRPASHLVSLPPEMRVSDNHANPNGNAAPATAEAAGASTPRGRNHAFAAKADSALASKAGAPSNLGRGSGFSLKAFEKLHSYYGALEIYTVPSAENAAPVESASSNIQPLAQLSSNATGNSAVDNAINTVANPVAWLNEINWGSSIVAIVLIVFGVLMAFAGFALFKIILFIAGFYSFSLLTVFILDLVAANLQGEQLTNFNNNAAIIFGVCVLIMGIVGGALFLCLWRLGLFFIGALLGYTISAFILAVTGSSFISSDVWRYVFIGAFSLVFAIAILFVEKPLLIISTAISGAFALTMGIDVFVRTGFVAAVTGVANSVKNSGAGAIENGVKGIFGGSTLVMAIVFVAVAVLGIVVQFVVSGRTQGNGRFSHAAYDGKPRPGVHGWGYKKAVPSAEKA
ncbi:hypothetical protein BJ742DRAFT_834156 [Cladochytrium replicatum]|nr:hypothetical protein BJ742DRAFT_834156 [Cladochytrium replicatum]